MGGNQTPAEQIAEDIRIVRSAHDFDSGNAPYWPEVLYVARAAERLANEVDRLNGLLAATPPENSVVRVRQIIEGYCSGPGMLNAGAAIDIAEACLDDMQREGLLTKAQAVTAEQIEAATRAVYDADDHDYTEASSFFHGMLKPYLENDYDRYESMTRAALTAPGGKQ
jgi:hypothetical protein